MDILGRGCHISYRVLELYDLMHGGHGNIGSKAGIEFYKEFLADFNAAVGKALGEIAFGSGVDPATINSHTIYLPTWLDLIAENVTEALRPKYGKYYGFEDGTPSNARMAAISMFFYQ